MPQRCRDSSRCFPMMISGKSRLHKTSINRERFPQFSFCWRSTRGWSGLSAIVQVHKFFCGNCLSGVVYRPEILQEHFPWPERALTHECIVSGMSGSEEGYCMGMVFSALVTGMCSGPSMVALVPVAGRQEWWPCDNPASFCETRTQGVRPIPDTSLFVSFWDSYRKCDFWKKKRSDDWRKDF